MVRIDGVLDGDGGIGGGRGRKRLTSSHGHIDDISDDIGDIGLLVHSLVSWSSHGDSGTDESEDG